MVKPVNRGLKCPKYARIILKENARSDVWIYFGFPATEEGVVLTSNVTICQLCKIPVSSKGGSTSNMQCHLKTYHPVEYSKMKPKIVSHKGTSRESEAEDSEVLLDMPPPPKKQKILDFTPLDPSSEKECTSAVSKFISLAMQPFNIVENKAFTDMLKVFNPSYNLPGRKHFSNNAIPQLYNDTKEKLLELLQSAESNEICLTTDCWTSVNSVLFVAVTAHFLKEWEMISLCLSCVDFEEGHTSKNICEELKEKLTEWGLNTNLIISCTTNNLSNIVNAINSLEIQHIPCFGHTINIAIKRVMEIKILKKALNKVKRLQNYISNSWNLSRDLADGQILLSMPQMKLPIAYPTHWGSTFKLCKIFLDNQLLICKVLRDYPSKKHLELEKNEISTLEAFVDCTKHFEVLTKNLSGEYMTASTVIPVLKKVKKNLECKDNDSPFVQLMKKEILSALEEKYLNQSTLMDILTTATVCDPRFRTTYTLNKEEAEKSILSQMTEIYALDNYLNLNAEKKEKKGLEKYLDSEDEDSEDETLLSKPSKKAVIELKNFLSMPKVSINDNPLNWWKSHASSFPSLKVLAKKYLAIQGTSVPLERIFSTGNNVITRNRTSLKPKNAEMFVFLSQNSIYV